MTTAVRYSILSSSIEEVEAAGGKDIQAAKYSGIIFATLTEDKAKALEQAGIIVTPVPKIRAETIAPPEPIVSVPKYTPSEYMEIAGLEELRYITDPPLYGEGINVAVLGTGMLETHEQLKGRVIYRKNFTSGPMRDGFDHDTAVTSIIVALAPKCGILNMKVIDDEGEGTEEDVVMAIEECIVLHENQSDLAPSVLNLSFGASDTGNKNSPMRVACRTAIEIGIWVFASCGNSGPYPGTIMSPACERYVFAAGSAKYYPNEKTFVVSDFSSRGPTLEGVTKPDAVLFGEDLRVASSASDTAATHKSGTSFTTPFAAGMAALFMEGVARKAQTMVELGEIEQSMFYYVPAREIMDEHLPRICTKPAGVLEVKDNNYGEGLPLGPLVMQALQPAAGGAAMLAGILPLIIMIPMMGIMIKAVKAPAK